MRSVRGAAERSLATAAGRSAAGICPVASAWRTAVAEMGVSAAGSG